VHLSDTRRVIVDITVQPKNAMFPTDGIGRRGRIAGFDLVELYPPADIDGLSALTAARLVVNVIGTIVREGP
jgi:arginase family enzyme